MSHKAKVAKNKEIFRQQLEQRKLERKEAADRKCIKILELAKNFEIEEERDLLR